MKDRVVCVTGASGYLASHLVYQLLAKGYFVRGTVRNPDDEKKVGFLMTFPGAQQRLKLFKADLLLEGSFDDAISGCDFVFHTASPFANTVSNPQRDLIDPAVNGTKNVLASVNRASSVKRVILTSSIAAIYHAPNDRGVGHVFTEEDWNERSSLRHNPYNLSKTLAEKAAWAEVKKQNRWSLVTINPGLIFGPTISGRDDAESIGIMKKIVDGTLSLTGAPQIVLGIADVRNVAEAHIKAAESVKAHGRYICVSDHVDFLEMARAAASDGKYIPGLPKKYTPRALLYVVGPAIGLTWHFIKNNVGLPLKFDNSKIQKDLSIQFIKTEKMMVDMVDSIINFGIYSPPTRRPLSSSSSRWSLGRNKSKKAPPSKPRKDSGWSTSSSSTSPLPSPSSITSV